MPSAKLINGSCDIANAIQKATQLVSSGQVQDQEARNKLHTTALALVAALEDPVEAIFRVAFQVHENAALRIAVAMGLFEMIVEGGEAGQTAAELAARSGAEYLLIVRIMRVLTAMGFFREIACEAYGPTSISRSMLIPGIKEGIRHLYDESACSAVKLHEFLARNQFRNPEDCRNGPFQYAFGTKLSNWEWLSEHPDRLKVFNTFMIAHRKSATHWSEYYPVDRLTENIGENDVLLVDVGGGRGHDLEALRARHPNLRGRLVLQDLPDTLKEVSEMENCFETCEYDFFTPQPIQGARAYYFRSIFHDWPDSACIEILKNTVPMMDKSSRLLIDDFALPDKECPLFPALMDMNMMALFPGMERTESHWQRLLGSVGFKVVEFWTPDTKSQSLIEAMIVE